MVLIVKLIFERYTTIPGQEKKYRLKNIIFSWRNSIFKMWNLDRIPSNSPSSDTFSRRASNGKNLAGVPQRGRTCERSGGLQKWKKLEENLKKTLAGISKDSSDSMPRLKAYYTKSTHQMLQNEYSYNSFIESALKIFK